MTFSSGDSVRIKTTPVTEQLGLAGLSGIAFGTTSPSDSGEPFIGNPANDFAIGVFFKERDEVLWFTLDLLEPVHGHNCSGSLAAEEKSPEQALEE